MKASSISTAGIAEATRQSVLRLQARLLEAQKQLSSGRLADPGAALGYKAGESVSLRREHAVLAAMIDANSSASTRLSVSETALKGISDAATEFVGVLLGVQSSDQSAKIITDHARSSLAAFTDLMNQSVNGTYVFGGINSGTRPLSTYIDQPTGASRQAVANAFLAEFGISQSSPNVRDITPDQMKDFLAGSFTNLFEDLAWKTNWSNAADQNITSKISPTESVITSVNANDGAFRALARAYTMLADLGVENLSPETFKVVAESAGKLAAQAVGDLTTLGARLGAAQERIGAVSDRMYLQSDILTSRINDLETVDPYEASARVNELMRQVDTAYALTARIQQLSLLNYI